MIHRKKEGEKERDLLHIIFGWEGKAFDLYFILEEGRGCLILTEMTNETEFAELNRAC